MKRFNKNEFIEKQENEMEKLLYKELPNLLHRILSIRLMPSMYSSTILKVEIEEIKRITNTECESALNILKIKSPNEGTNDDFVERVRKIATSSLE